MYGHPKLAKQWAMHLKPAATPRQIEQARIMRTAKIAKRNFQERQLSFDVAWSALNACTDLQEWEKNQIYSDMVNKK